MTIEAKDVISILYFLEESLGFRVSPHWLRRYLETKDDADLERLLVNVARENFIDFNTWSDLVIDNHRLDLSKGSLTEIKRRMQDEIEGYSLLDILDDPGTLVHSSDLYFSQQSWVIGRLVQAMSRNPGINWKDALSRNQVKSKVWLIDTMHRNGWLDKDSRILLVGGWVGLLTVLMNLKGHRFHSAINFDTDPDVHPAAQILNMNPLPNLRSICQDIRTVQIKDYPDHIIIDSIVEHFADHGQWVRSLPSGTKVVLQGNDMFDIEDHVNCHRDLEAFVSDSGLSDIVWQGQLDLPGCTRFMVLGKV